MPGIQLDSHSLDRVSSAIRVGKITDGKKERQRERERERERE